jgi:phosphoadenosine phosphosulfate reductase
MQYSVSVCRPLAKSGISSQAVNLYTDFEERGGEFHPPKLYGVCRFMLHDTNERVAADLTSSYDSYRPDVVMAEKLSCTFMSLDPVERLRTIGQAINGRLVFTTSFGLEDQALTHLIVHSGIPAEIVTLDTGRLFPETYAVWSETEQRYDIRIRGYYPSAESVESLVLARGINGFYDTPAARKSCCDVRKVEPLRRALTGAAVWITGLRADQSAVRQNMGFVTWESDRNLLKANPLLDWSRDRVADLVGSERIPNNPLHQRGFLSIGCAPCTRAIKPGEPERAGRWWWENESLKECGLHVASDVRLTRAQAAA